MNIILKNNSPYISTNVPQEVATTQNAASGLHNTTEESATEKPE